jgi:hypothetical protein
MTGTYGEAPIKSLLVKVLSTKHKIPRGTREIIDALRGTACRRRRRHGKTVGLEVIILLAFPSSSPSNILTKPLVLSEL